MLKSTKNKPSKFNFQKQIVKIQERAENHRAIKKVPTGAAHPAAYSHRAKRPIVPTTPEHLSVHVSSDCPVHLEVAAFVRRDRLSSPLCVHVGRECRIGLSRVQSQNVTAQAPMWKY